MEETEEKAGNSTTNGDLLSAFRELTKVIKINAEKQETVNRQLNQSINKLNTQLNKPVTEVVELRKEVISLRDEVGNMRNDTFREPEWTQGIVRGVDVVLDEMRDVAKKLGRMENKISENETWRQKQRTLLSRIQEDLTLAQPDLTPITASLNRLESKVRNLAGTRRVVGRLESNTGRDDATNGDVINQESLSRLERYTRQVNDSGFIMTSFWFRDILHF